MRANDVMSTKLITIAPDTKVRDAVKLMLEHRISGLPVVDSSGKLVGLISESDLVLDAEPGLPIHLQLLEDLLGVEDPTRHFKKIRDIGDKPVSALMVKEVVTASPDTPVGELVSLLVNSDFKRIPIVDKNQLAGIVTRADIVRLMK